MEKLLPYHLKHSSQPPEDDLKILIAELGTYTRVFLILDALDEAPGDMGMLIRTKLLSQLPSNVRAICTSRKLDDIIVSFDKDTAQVKEGLFERLGCWFGRFEGYESQGLSMKSIKERKHIWDIPCCAESFSRRTSSISERESPSISFVSISLVCLYS
jgi:hypothetical protein